jgi:DNA-damage-inducible protein D
LGKSGIKPEHLPPAEDIKKVQRKFVSEDKRIVKNTMSLKKKGK